MERDALVIKGGEEDTLMIELPEDVVLAKKINQTLPGRPRKPVATRESIAR
jgi:hypothetical protein